MGGQRAVGGDRPAFKRVLPIIGGAQPDLSALCIYVSLGDIGGGDGGG